MKTKTTETTKTSQTVTLNSTIKDDNDMDIARMSATINASMPFGNASLVVVNRNLFDANRDEIKKLYLEFQEQAANTELNDETTENDPDVSEL